MQSKGVVVLEELILAGAPVLEAPKFGDSESEGSRAIDEGKEVDEKPNINVEGELFVTCLSTLETFLLGCNGENKHVMFPRFITTTFTLLIG